MKVGRNDPCPCGSGRKHKQCCMAESQRAVATPTAPLFARAQTLLQREQYREATRLYERILAINPRHHQAMHYMGMAALHLGDTKAALDLMGNSIALKPDDAMYHNNLALALDKEGNVQEAQKHFLAALQIDPRYTVAHFNLGRMLLAHLPVQAYEHLSEVVRRHPEDTEALAFLADAAVKLGEVARSLSIYEQLLQQNPGLHALRSSYARALRDTGRYADAAVQYRELLRYPDWRDVALLELFGLAERQSRLDEAEGWLEEMAKSYPDNAMVSVLHARLRRRQRDYPGALALLEAIDVESLADDARPAYYLERGLVLDRMKRYDEAFDAYVAYKNWYLVHRARIRYNAAANRRRLLGRQEFFTRSRVAELAQYANPPAPAAHEPLFVVGFPRSGTTLVEQILASHPHISAGDELPYIYVVATRCAMRLKSEKPFPACLADLAQSGNAGALDEFRKFYLDNVQERGIPAPDAHYFTDKMPLNEVELGLIHLLFPKSPIIHVVRHPLDVCLSSYFNYLTHGDYCAFELTSVATHFVLVMELVEHYLAELDLRYLRVRYEDLLADPEPQVRRMLDFIGEPWDERCLAFHQSDRVARTASYAQVNQPLYTSSRYRYRHYIKQLEPIIPILEPVIHRLGYTIE